MELLAFSVVGLWFEWIWPVLLFVIGLGAVVFVHELGHFLVAKWVDIKVERFALGFGPRLFGIKWGETDYCVNLLPLGGYVKMLGQEDVKQVDGDLNDPRAFNNKSVGARFAVVAAGVVMNVIFAAILFLIIAMVGKQFPAPVVGVVAPGMPADEAEIEWLGDGAASQPASRPTTHPAADADRGLKPGDHILNIETDSLVLNWIGHDLTRFSDLYMCSALADTDEQFIFTFQRDIGGTLRTGRAKLGVKIGPQGMPAFGIGPASDLTFAKPEDYIYDSPFQPGDTVVSIAGRAVQHHWDIEPVEKTLTGGPVNVVVKRDGSDVTIPVLPKLSLNGKFLWLKDGKRIRGDVIDIKEDSGGKTLTFRQLDGKERTVPESDIAGGINAIGLDILGLIPRMEAMAVVKGSPAADAGLRHGDVIVGYGDQGAPTLQQFHDISQTLVENNTSAPITVLRGSETKTLQINAVNRNDQAQVGILNTPDESHLVVAAVREGSPAEKAGVVSGATILSVNAVPVTTWTDLYEQLKKHMGKAVDIDYEIGSVRQTFTIDKLGENIFDPNDFRFSLFSPDEPFEPLLVTEKTDNPLKALAWGGEETLKMIVSSYLSLKGLITGSVSVKNVSGPVGIGSMAIQAGRRSLSDFVYLMAVISAILAVMNFLPLPVVDGGIAVFLLIEKIRGKPLPDKVQYSIQVLGLLLLLAVFVAITWQDIAKLVSNAW